MSDGDRAKFRKENVGVIYQFHHLLPEFNVLENVMMPLRIKEYPCHSEEEGFPNFRESWVRTQSKRSTSDTFWGERQRVAIARAWSQCRVLSLQMSQLEILIGIMPTMFFD